MKKIVKKVGLLLMMCGLMIGSGVATASSSQGKGADWLFVLESSKGTLKHVAGNHYVLSLPIRDLSSVLAFTDRPNRQATQMTLAQYAEAVHRKSSDSFDKNPPNAVLTFGGNKNMTRAYEISSYSKTSRVISYNLVLLGKQSPLLQKGKQVRGPVSLFIDSNALAAFFCGISGNTWTEMCDQA